MTCELADSPVWSRLRLAVVLSAFALLLLALAGPASAWDNLDIAAELRRPGVRLVVVEFYADWCKPCRKAVPLWNELHERYKDRGLRLLVVSIGDGGTCSNPGWRPDKVVCDFDGKLQTAFGADTLPQAFLYSWQGNLLVKGGHFDGVKKAVDTYFGRSPRILVGEPEDQDGKKVLNGSALRETVRTDLRRLAKFEMVAGDKEMASLRKLRRKGYDPGYDNAGRCQLGQEVSANSELKIRLFAMGKDRTLSLQLFSAESGCMLASSKARVGSSGLEAASFEAVGTLVEQLIGRGQRGNGSNDGEGLSYEDLLKESQELDARDQALEAAQAKRRIEIEGEWNKVQEVAAIHTLSAEKRATFVQQFVDKYPEGNPYSTDAAALAEALRSRPTEVSGHANLAGGGGTLALGNTWGTLSMTLANTELPVGVAVEVLRMRQDIFQWTVLKAMYGGFIRGAFYWSIGVLGIGAKVSLDRTSNHELGVVFYPLSGGAAEIGRASEEDDTWNVITSFLQLQLYYRFNADGWHAEASVVYPVLWFGNKWKGSGDAMSAKPDEYSNRPYDMVPPVTFTVGAGF